jgi:hypothetical protein
MEGVILVRGRGVNVLTIFTTMVWQVDDGKTLPPEIICQFRQEDIFGIHLPYQAETMVSSKDGSSSFVRQYTFVLMADISRRPAWAKIEASEWGMGDTADL